MPTDSSIPLTSQLPAGIPRNEGENRCVLLLTTIIGLLSVAATVVAWEASTQAAADQARARFETHSLEVLVGIEYRINDYLQTLRGAHGLVLAEGTALTARKWSTYISAIVPDTAEVGVDSVAYSRVVADKGLADMVRQRRAEGDTPDFTAHSLDSHASGGLADHILITYIEPSSRHNAITMGADTLSNSFRRAAMETACDANVAAATAPTQLIDVAPMGKPTHFVLYMPVYGEGTIETVQQRRSLLSGYVSSAINIGNMTRAIVNTMDSELRDDIRLGLSFVVTDVTNPSVPMLVTDQFGAREAGQDDLLTKTEIIEVGRRKWSIAMAAPGAIYTANSVRPAAVTSAVGLIGMLITGLAWALGYLWLKGRDVARVNMKLLERDEQLRQLAVSDALTGLGNRRQFIELGALEWARLMRQGRPLAVFMIDADHFKAVNDTHGHAVGDATLVMLADVIRDTLRDCDLIARIGGEEFAVLLPETESEAAGQVAERLRRSVESAPVATATGCFTITVSIGIAKGCAADPDFAAVLERADTALYAAKRGGRNRVAWVLADTTPMTVAGTGA